MSHKYECGICRYKFIVSDQDEYDSGMPQERDCPSCKKALGQVLYHGCGQRLNVISDDLGMKGVKSMVTGNTHDSKSAYRKELKAHGMVEMGSDAKVEERKEIRGNYDCRADVARALDQVGYSERKGLR